MILVSGTHRSGTSMWMQILRAAGLPILGEAFPQRMAGLTEINPEGFWETRLRLGVNFTTNPDPETGIYLSPDATRGHVLKVFLRGLPGTEIAYLDQVLITLRPWREHTLSVQRLIEAEEAPLLAQGTPEALERLRQRRAGRSRHPTVVTWWYQLYGAIRDIATRRYPHHIVPYSRLMANPRAEIATVLDWLGEGELEPAVAAVRQDLRSFERPELAPPEGVGADAVAVFDDVLATFEDGADLQPALIRRMNAVQAELLTRFPPG